LKGFPFGISSTLLRERAEKGLPLEGMTPPAVAEAIQRDKIYQTI
jgi:nicotinic acid mononucleotide adenylyltransferase